MISSRDSAREVIQRARNSALANDDEIQLLDRWLSGPGPDDNNAEETAMEILFREAGRSDSTILEVERLGTPLASLETALISDLEDRLISTQSSYAVLKWMLYVAIGLTIVLIVLCPALAPYSGAGAASAGASSILMIALTFLLMRAYQHSREAGDRLSDKIIATRFIRLALSDYLATADSSVLDASVQMFLGHHKPDVPPLGPEDLRAIAQTVSRNRK